MSQEEIRKKRYKHLKEHQTFSHSEYSPGLVEDDEILLRVGFNPESVKDGKPTKTAIPGQDFKDPGRGGFSVDRKLYVNPKLIRKRAKSQQDKSGKESERIESFIYELPCNAVRYQMVDEAENPINVVVDSALSDNIAHSSIYTVMRSDSEIKKLKSQMYPYLLKYKPLEDYLSQNLNIWERSKRFLHRMVVRKIKKV